MPAPSVPVLLLPKSVEVSKPCIKIDMTFLNLPLAVHNLKAKALFYYIFPGMPFLEKTIQKYRFTPVLC